ncbi:MAG: DNA-processing protein DprA, partial [Lachnospiraceae bacterium]|nr:DNA-processing protein DprA [Lachnospiraceae bacterium]
MPLASTAPHNPAESIPLANPLITFTPLVANSNPISLAKKTVAIVGARNCTTYGQKIAKYIGFELATNGVNDISGLARGIDSAGVLGAVDD